MGSDLSKSTLRGLLVPEKALSWWDDQSGEYDVGGTRLATIQCASPEAGIPVPDATTSLALRATGEQSAAIYVRTAIGGIPGTDRAGTLWSATSATADLRGCDLPNVLCAWDDVFVTANESALHPRAVTLSDGTILVCYDHESGGTADGVYVIARSPSAATWGSPVLVIATSQHVYPVLLVRDDRVYLYRWDRIPSGDYQIALHYSDDSGATWTAAGDVLSDAYNNALYQAAPDGYKWLAVGYLAGQTLLVAHLRKVNSGGAVYEDVLSQWASDDGGMTFSLVGTWTGADQDHAGAYPQVIVTGGLFLVGWLHSETVSGDASCWRPMWAQIASAWTDLETCDDVSTGAAQPACVYGLRVVDVADYYLGTFYGWCAWLDDDGAVYFTGTIAASGADADDFCSIYRSDDSGETWRHTGTSAFPDWTAANASVQAWNLVGSSNHDEALADLCAVAQRGRTVVVTGYYHGGALSEWLIACYLGGHNTCTMSLRDESREPTMRTAWDSCEISTHIPEPVAPGGVPWTKVGAGTETLTARVLRLQTTAAQSLYYNATPSTAIATTAAQGLKGEWCLQVTSGTARHRLAADTGGATDYNVEARVTSTGISLWDLNLAGGTQIGSTQTITAARYVRIRLILQGAAVRLLWCYDSTSEDRDWDTVASSTTLTNGGGAADLVRWGVTSVGAADVLYREWKYASGAYVGSNATDAPGRTNLYPRSLMPTPVYAGYGVSLSAVTGPTAVGDTWTITPTWQYGYGNLDPRSVPSPRRPWRSRASADMGLATSIRLSWSVGNVVEYGLSDLWGVWLDGCNCAGIAVYLYYGGAWNLVGTTGTDSFTTSREGKTLLLSGATSGAKTFRRGELDDCGVEGITAGNSDWRTTIEESIPGITRIGSGTSRLWACRMATYDPVWSATPTVKVWPRRHLLLIRLSGYSSTIRGIQLRIPRNAVISPSTPSAGYYEIGAAVMGPIWVWGTQYSWGRTLTAEPLQEILTAEDGTRTVRALGPIRRRVEFGWNEGVDLTQALTDADPDYATFATGGNPLAFIRDTPMEMLDQLRSLQGAATPVVYCPYLPRNTTGGFSGWGQGAIYGRIVDAVSVDSVVGDEEASEVQRVQKVVIEEEV